MAAGFFGAFLRRAAREPERTAFVLEGEIGRHLTLGALESGARRWAAALRARGARRGEVILIALPLSADLLEAFLGALWAGCVPSLMPYPSAKQDPVLFWTSHDRLFGRLGGGLVVAEAANRAAIVANIASVEMRVLTPDDATATEASDDPAHAWSERDVACLQHSSGTTGLKKGVALSFEKIDWQIEAYAAAIGIGAEDTIVSWLPLYHDMGFVACLLMPLRLGIKTVLLDPFAWLVDPLSLFRSIERHAGRFVWLPNFAFAHLVNAADGDERRFDLSSLRAVIDCSETCRAETLEAFARRFASFGLAETAPSTCYAMAETVFALTQSPIGERPRIVHLDRAALDAGCVVETSPRSDAATAISAGRPIAGVDLVVLDDELAPAGADRVGRIAVRAPFLFEGYHLEPERSRAAFRGDAYVTGDLGFRIGEDVFVLGRHDDLLILLGRNVFANEIETILGDVDGLKPGRVLAMGLANEDVGSQDLVILAEPGDSAVDQAAVRATIRLRLESILGITPKKIVFVDRGWLVKSTSGKISRAENRRKYATSSAPSPPRG